MVVIKASGLVHCDIDMRRAGIVLDSAVGIVAEDCHAFGRLCHVLATLKRTRKNRTGGKIEEEKEKKENGKEGTQIYSGIQGTDGGAI